MKTNPLSSLFNILTIFITVLLLTVTGCSEEGSTTDPNNSGGNNGTNPTTLGTNNAKAPQLSFKLTGAIALVTTDTLATTTGKSSRKPNGDVIKEFYFYDYAKTPEEYAARKAARKANGGTYNKASFATNPPAGSGNLFIVKEDGTIDLALDTDADIKIGYSLLTKDRSAVIITLDMESWSNGNYEIANQTNCTIFKVTLADSSYECLDEGYAAVNMGDNFVRNMSGASRKAVQMDSSDTVYYMAIPFTADPVQCDTIWTDFNNDGQQTPDELRDECQGGNLQMDYGGNPVLRIISADGTTKEITPNNKQIFSFQALNDGSIVYMYRDTLTWVEGLNFVTKTATGYSTNTLTDTSEMWWTDTFYAVDDANTIIFGNANQGWDTTKRKVQFAQKHPDPTAVGARIIRNLPTNIIDSAARPAGIVMGDDGYIYSNMIQDSWYCDNTGSCSNTTTFKLYRILPFTAQPKVTVELTSANWWEAIRNVRFQVSRGGLCISSGD